MKFENWQKRILASLWISYASFYLLRVNLSVALPGIITEYGYSKTQLGIIFTVFSLVYAVGQFINGQIGDRVNTRYYVAAGLVLSAVVNVLFGFAHALTGMVLLWALNGIFQSMGWAPSIKTLANWFSEKDRDRAGGIMGSSYQIGNAASWALAGFVVGLFGWRWAFWVPAIICVVIALNWIINGRTDPKKAGFDIEFNKEAEQPRSSLKFVFTNKYIWCLALALAFLNIVRYGFMDWAPTYMFEVQKATISLAAYKALAFPLAGSIGAIFAGYLASRKKGIGTGAIMLLGLTIAIILYPFATNWILDFVLLLIIGFLTFGPHVLIVGILPMHFGKKLTSSATGFIDGFGYVGASLSGVVGGWLIDKYGWNASFMFWVIAAFCTMLMMVILWRMYKNDKSI